MNRNKCRQSQPLSRASHSSQVVLHSPAGKYQKDHISMWTQRETQLVPEFSGISLSNKFHKWFLSGFLIISTTYNYCSLDISETWNSVLTPIVTHSTAQLPLCQKNMLEANFRFKSCVHNRLQVCMWSHVYVTAPCLSYTVHKYWLLCSSHIDSISQCIHNQLSWNNSIVN